MEVTNHTLAFVRWINACNNKEELEFCNLVLLRFLLASCRQYQAPIALWNNITYYLTLCMQNKRRALQESQFKILTH